MAVMGSLRQCLSAPRSEAIAMQFSEIERRELIALEEAMWRPETRFAPEFQQRHFAADFFEFGRSGRVYGRSDVIRFDDQPIAAKLPLLNLEIRRLDTDTAQITYDSEVTYDGIVERAHRSSIWSRTAHGWIMRFHQGTPF
jgi:hypothetical protein